MKIIQDKRGKIIPIEHYDIPFKVKRTFIIYDVPKNSVRGNHAHYKTKQFLICIKGRIEVNLDYGKIKTKVLLQQGQTILIDKLIWDSQKFLTTNSILLVLCSTNYDKKDYIFNYKEFINATN